LLLFAIQSNNAIYIIDQTTQQQILLRWLQFLTI